MSGANLRNPNATPDTYLTRPTKTHCGLRGFYSFVPPGATRCDASTVQEYGLGGYPYTQARNDKPAEAGLCGQGTMRICPSGDR